MLIYSTDIRINTTVSVSIKIFMYVIGMSRKAKGTVQQAMRAQRRSRGIALLFL